MSTWIDCPEHVNPREWGAMTWHERTEVLRRLHDAEAARARAQLWIVLGELDDMLTDAHVEACRAANADRLAPCGTPAAYRRHLRRDEPVDEACREAARRYRHEQYDHHERTAA